MSITPILLKVLVENIFIEIDNKINYGETEKIRNSNKNKRVILRK